MRSVSPPTHGADPYKVRRRFPFEHAQESKTIVPGVCTFYSVNDRFEFQPAHARFREAVQASFKRQGLMKALGGEIRRIEPGRVEIEMPYSDTITQQHGYFHGAAIAAVADSAGGYAALTLMRPDEEVLAVEFKINLLRPAVGERLVAAGAVLRAGRFLVISRAEVTARDGDDIKTVAVMLQTNFRLSSGR